MLRSNKDRMPGAEADYVSEPEVDPEEEIDEEPEEDPEEEIEEESEEDPEEEIIEDPEEDPEEDKNEVSDEEELEVENSHLSPAICGGIGSNKVSGNELNANPEEESKSEIGIVNISVDGECASKPQDHSETSRRRRKSRWKTPQIDGTSKKRKTRWDENDSKNGLLDNLLELWMDPKTMSLRMKLMEINRKMQSLNFYDERPAGERSPSPEPIDNNLGIRINTRDARIKETLMNERKCILSKLAETNSTPKEKKFVKKLFIPQREYPTYNFIGLILGPKGNSKKKMEKKTGAKIFIRGKGSGNPVSEDEESYVLVEAAEQKALDAAVALIEKLLIPVDDRKNDHKRAQLVELAKMRGKYKDHNICDLCKEQGHKKYACPLQDSTFKVVCCNICGSLGHLTSNCSGSGLPQFCKDKSNKDVDPANLYVSCLPLAVDDKRFKEMFLPFGGIESARVMRDLATGLSKGYGFVKFENPSDAADAVKYMNGHKMDSQVLSVRVAGMKLVPTPLIHTSYHYESSYFPSSSGYFGYDINVARPEAVNVPPYVVSSATETKVKNNVSSGYDFVDRIIPSSFPNSVSQFPGDPDYPGSQFKSYFATAATNETQNHMPESERKSSFWGGSSFP